jgi:hypothetical protein
MAIRFVVLWLGNTSLESEMPSQGNYAGKAAKVPGDKFSLGRTTHMLSVFIVAQTHNLLSGGIRF